MVTIDEPTIAMAFALLGVVFSVGWLVIGLYGLNTLREIRDGLRSGDDPHS